AAIHPPMHSLPLSDEELSRRIDFEIVRDIPAEFKPETERQRLIISTGMRSWLRVPLLLSGEVRGSLSLFHRQPNRFAWEDAEVARRLADRIALVLSHRQMNEEARVAAETRKLATMLEERIE